MTVLQTDAELFAAARQRLCTCALGDVMDDLGFRHQFLPPQIRPLQPKMIMVGRAMPVLSTDVFADELIGSANALMQEPFGLMLEAVDDLKKDEIFVSTGSSPGSALWGEMMSIRAQQLGAAGAVVNGYMRDTVRLTKLRFPAFSFGSFGQDSRPRQKVIDFRIPIQVGCAEIGPADVLFGDADGVCVIPREAWHEVFRISVERLNMKRRVRCELNAGTSVVNAFEKYRML
jgi:regulator of RNase E activity RraA